MSYCNMLASINADFYINDESGGKTRIKVKVDTYGMVSIEIGNSLTLRMTRKDAEQFLQPIKEACERATRYEGDEDEDTEDDDDCSVYRMRALGSERHHYI